MQLHMLRSQQLASRTDASQARRAYSESRDGAHALYAPTPAAPRARGRRCAAPQSGERADRERARGTERAEESCCSMRLAFRQPRGARRAVQPRGTTASSARWVRGLRRVCARAAAAPARAARLLRMMLLSAATRRVEHAAMSAPPPPLVLRARVPGAV